MAVSSDDTTILIDAGVMFPGLGQFGVNLIIPDLTYFRTSDQRLAGLILTHGHEDHIGGVPYLWDLLNGPVYGTELTLGLLKPKLKEHGIDPAGRLQPVTPGDAVQMGPLEVEFLRVTHSMPDCTAVAIHSDVGTIVHTGDYKIDQTPPDGESMDLDRFAELGNAGVLALFGDSTNVERRGSTESERAVVSAFDEIFTYSAGKIIVTTFASSLHRVQLLIDLAAQFRRKVVFVGRGMKRNATIAAELGRLEIPPGIEIPESDVTNYPANQVLCLVTGSQGEPLAALSRIAVDHHRHIKLKPLDIVVFSARAIPGNHRFIGQLMDRVARRGASIVHEDDALIHVSGHGSVDDLTLMLSLVKPRYFVPIHGEYRYLAKHAKLAKNITHDETAVFLMENGDRLCFDDNGAWRGAPMPTGRILIDGTRTGEVVDEILQDRRHLAGDGVVVLIVAIDRLTGMIVDEPTVITRGFVGDPSTVAMRDEIHNRVDSVLRSSSPEERTDHDMIQERIRIELQRSFRKQTGRRPLIIPIVMEM
jgi:ribonuclease J